MILYRPVGLQELALIYDSGMKAFPARLPQQPIFYPVLQLEYARQTASDWNAKNKQFAGYVTQFKVEDDYIGQFEEHKVGGSQYRELWIPAEELEEFNRHIAGQIKVLEAYFGDAFEGFIPEKHGLQGKNAVEQFTLLTNSYLYKRMEFYLELKRNHKAVFLNYPFWQQYEFKNPGLKEKIINAIKEAWRTSFPKIPLPLPPPVQEESSPVQPAQAERLVDPMLEEETSTDPWVEPHEEQEPLREEADPDSLPHAVQDEIKPVERTLAPPGVQRFEKPARQEVTPGKPAPTPSVQRSVQEEISPAEPLDEDSLTEPVDEDAASEEPVPEDGGQREIAPVRQTRAHVLGTPMREERALPRQTGSHFAQGIQLGRSGEYREAIDELSMAVEEDPGNIVAHTSLGVAFRRSGQDKRALASYETSLKIDPKYAEAHYFRANILYSQGNAREAIAGYTVAIGLKPELIHAHLEAAPRERLTDYSSSPAEMYWIARPALRILGLNKLLETNWEQANLFKERAAAYSRLWNYDQAVADYTASLTLQPDDAGALHARGVAYEQLGQIEQAQQDFQQAIAIQPQLSDVYLHRGVSLGNMGNLRQSIASLSEGIRLAPKNPDAYFNRGTAHFQQGDFERAIDDFAQVIRLSPSDEAAYYWRGISHEEAGHAREAVADYKQFLALSRDANARAEVEQRLSRWREETRKSTSSRSGAMEDRQKTSQGSPENVDRKVDLHDLIAALGERALQSIWFASNVDCSGETAEELSALSSQDRPVEGRDLLRLTSGIRQTRGGDFYAVDPGAPAHWLFIRAWDGSGFYMETDDPKSKERLRTHFPSLEEVEGAAPPYESLFIRI